MKFARLLSAAILAFALGLVVLPAAPASAAVLGPFPPVAFQIEDRTGTCVSTEWDPRNQLIGGGGTINYVWSKPCDPLNLHEWFSYNQLTRQLSSAARPGWCLQATTRLGLPLIYEVCDTTNPWQRWENVGPNSAGQYSIRRVGVAVPGSALRFYWSKFGPRDSIQLEPLLTSQVGAEQLFRFRHLVTTA